VQHYEAGPMAVLVQQSRNVAIFVGIDAVRILLFFALCDLPHTSSKIDADILS